MSPDNPEAICPDCGGNGRCAPCAGMGDYGDRMGLGNGPICPDCGGNGRCAECLGTGERQ